jgi:hypothetical protein
VMDQHVGGLVKRPANRSVAGAADATGPIRFAGLEAPRGETKVCTHRSGIAKPPRLVHAGRIRQSYQRARSHVIMPISLHH